MGDENNKNFEYNPDIDSLTIYHSKSKIEKIKGSIVINNFIFDISTNGSFIGLEIDNASEVFGVSPSVLSRIKNASIRTVVQGDIIMLIYSVYMDNKEYERALMVPKEKINLTA